MRFHVVSLPHTQTTEDFATCAYTNKVRHFCRMMMDRGHTVFLYAGEQNMAPCTEHVVCISEQMRAAAVGSAHYTTASFDATQPHWQVFNHHAIAGIAERQQSGDFLCLIAGLSHKLIADALPNLTAVEYGIGYGGTFAKHRVFESYAWMHSIYGFETCCKRRSVNDCDGGFSDAVIPGYLDPKDFPLVADKQNYLLYVGRMVDRKGLRIAVDTAAQVGLPLVMAGPGTPPNDSIVQYVGEVGPVERAELMGGAHALLAPTVYIEPFGNVVIEAHACGTPTLTTDWGAFTETNIHGVTGYRCRSLTEFVNGVHACGTLNPGIICQSALTRYSLDVVGGLYEDYFCRIGAA